MKDHESHNATIDASGKALLPLYDFFIALKKNNFLVTPSQITDANRLIGQYSDTVESEWELCNYLTPIFAKSEEEQIQFRQVFEEFFIPLDKNQGEKEPKKSTVKEWILLLGLPLLALIAFVVIDWIVEPPVEEPKEIILNLETLLAPPDSSKTQRRLDLRISVENDTSVKKKDIKSKIDWGDESVDTLLGHYYKRDGIYSLKAFVEIKDNLLSTQKDTIQTDVRICLSPATIRIESSFQDSIALGERYRLTAQIIGNQPDSVRWSTVDQKTLGTHNSHDLVAFANNAGDQNFFFEAFYGGVNAPCNIKEDISFLVYDATPKPEVALGISRAAKPVSPENKIYRRWYTLLVTSGLVSLSFLTFFYMRLRKIKKQHVDDLLEDQQQYDQLISSFSGKMGSINIPFQSNSFLPLPEPELSDVAKLMRRRIRDNASYVHLDKTISKAVRRAGFFEPVIDSRTQQSEFLVLIDQQSANNQQVKLFEFLLELLQKQNVYIDRYYYKTTLLQCYHENETVKTSLEKLSEKYPGHVLLILGDAHQLIYRDYSVIDQRCLQLLNRWQYKAIMTPISFKDWGQKEKKVLLTQLPVLPVDIRGQLLLMQKLFDQDVNILRVLEQYSSEFYEVAMVDFEDLDELLDYCEKSSWANIPHGGAYSNILFQWIAALAVYPKINWELSIAIGKAILDNHNMAHELNLTNLLRLVRIDWMKVGRFPDYTRLNLLKALSLENEIIARETILHTLQEIPETELNENHFAFEEKETQRLINEFNLHANDPIKYASYSNSKALFAQLNKEDLLTDITAKSYLENSELQWETLINKPPQNTQSSRKPENTTMKDYLGLKPEEKDQKAKVYFWGILTSLLLLIANILGFFGLRNTLNGESGQYSAFIYRAPVTDSIQFNFNFSDVSQSTRTLFLSIDGDSTDIIRMEKPEIGSDNFVVPSFQIPIVINDSTKQVMVHWNNRYLIDSSMVINYDSYDVTLSLDNAIPSPLSNAERWELAVKTNTLRGYSEYLKFCTEDDEGCHRDEINKAVAGLFSEVGYVQVLNSYGTPNFSEIEDFYLDGDFLIANEDRRVRNGIIGNTNFRNSTVKGTIIQGQLIKVIEYQRNSGWAKISYSDDMDSIGNDIQRERTTNGGDSKLDGDALLLNDYKIGFYFYPEQRNIAQQLVSYLESTGFKGRIQLYEEDKEFFESVNPPKGFEVRYEPETEVEVSKELEKLLSSFNPNYKFTRITVGNSTPGFISVFIPNYTGNGGFDKDQNIADPNTNQNTADSSNLGKQDVISDTLQSTSRNSSSVTKKEELEENTNIDTNDVPERVEQDNLTDTDGDGVIDIDDYCPNDKGSFDNNGCPGPNTKTNEIKWETLRLMDKGNTPFVDSKEKVNNLVNKIKRTIVNSSGKEKDNLKIRFWLMLIDDDNFLGSYLKFWEEQRQFSPAFLLEAKIQMEEVFDLIMNYEQKVNKNSQKDLEVFLDQFDIDTTTDTDGDGIIDQIDDCVDLPGIGQNFGCPENYAKQQTKEEPIPDSDGDGIANDKDACPDVAGTQSNDGCPEVTEEVQKQLNDYAKVILFDTSNSSIKAESSSLLIDILQILNEYKNAKFTVEGHTDSVGDAQSNQSLSESRAIAVRDYLIKQGIAADRLKAVGYGEDKPIATNKTMAGRAQNRRVEINLIK